MTLEEYVAAKNTLTQSLIDALIGIIFLFLTPGITRREWRNLLRSVYPLVKQHRDQATELARQFYDSQRAEQLPGSDRNDVFKQDNYPVEWFEQDMESTREGISEADSTDAAAEDFLGQAVKIVETGARRTMLRALDSDSEVLGWSRFDPKPPTCAFCTMMISRGPVYNSAATGGGKLDDATMEDLWRKDDTDAMNEMMNRWHPRCTCIIVPVYDKYDYPTLTQEEAALELYKKAVKAAKSGKYKKILAEMRKILRESRGTSTEDKKQLPVAS